MSTTQHNDVTTHHDHRDHGTQTRPARRTTELIAYLAAVLAVIVTAVVVGRDGDSTADPFNAEQALRYITFLTIGYMIARGLANSGTRGNARDNDGEPRPAAPHLQAGGAHCCMHLCQLGRRVGAVTAAMFARFTNTFLRVRHAACTGALLKEDTSNP